MRKVNELQLPEQSDVLDLLDTVWRGCDRATSHSWSRVNSSMSSALALAIGSGMKFGADDFAEIERRYRFHYWGGESRGGFAEGFYCTAVAEGNVSACQAFEKWKGRKPFIVDNVQPGTGARFAHRVGFRQSSRLCVGSRFTWDGREVTVTSFSEDGTYLTACTYHEPDQAHPYGVRVKQRYTITNRDIREQRRLLKQSA